MTDDPLPNNLGVTEKFREGVAEYLRGQDSVYNGVQILTNRQGDVTAKINEAINSAGVFGKVTVHKARMKRTGTKDILLESVDFYVDFYENVPLNQSSTGTNKGAWGLAESTLQLLYYVTLPCGGFIISPVEGADTLEDVTKDPDSGDLVVRVRFTTKLVIPAPATP